MVAEESQAAEVVRLAEGILAARFLVVGREELGGHNLATILR